jgi:hypothetical protein
LTNENKKLLLEASKARVTLDDNLERILFLEKEGTEYRTKWEIIHDQHEALKKVKSSMDIDVDKVQKDLAEARRFVEECKQSPAKSASPSPQKQTTPLKKA